jgi:carboxylesterase
MDFMDAAAEAFFSNGAGLRARTGVLLGHGFTGSPVSLREWARFLADRGFAVRLPVLAGHGTRWQDLARTPAESWYESYENAYRELAHTTDTVVAAGLSMGGTLALRLAAAQPVAGVVVVNPALAIADRRARYAGLLKYLLRSTPAIANNIRKEGVDEGAYPRTPVAAVAELYRLVADAVTRLPAVTAPALVFRSDTDAVVAENSIALLERHLGSPDLEIVRLANSYHVATMDHDAQLIFDRTVEFIDGLQDNQASKAGADSGA